MSNRQKLLEHAVGTVIDELRKKGFSHINNGCDLLFKKKDGAYITGCSFRVYDPNQNFRADYPNLVPSEQEYLVLVDMTNFPNDVKECVIGASMFDGKDEAFVEEHVKKKIYQKFPKTLS